MRGRFLTSLLVVKKKPFFFGLTRHISGQLATRSELRWKRPQDLPSCFTSWINYVPRESNSYFLTTILNSKLPRLVRNLSIWIISWVGLTSFLRMVLLLYLISSQLGLVVGSLFLPMLTTARKRVACFV